VNIEVENVSIIIHLKFHFSMNEEEVIECIPHSFKH